jgi:hypothetical protein
MSGGIELEVRDDNDFVMVKTFLCYLNIISLEEPPHTLPKVPARKAPKRLLRLLQSMRDEERQLAKLPPVTMDREAELVFFFFFFLSIV